MRIKEVKWSVFQVACKKEVSTTLLMGRVQIVKSAKNAWSAGSVHGTQKMLNKYIVQHVDFEIILTTSFEIVRVNHILISITDILFMYLSSKV